MFTLNWTGNLFSYWSWPLSLSWGQQRYANDTTWHKHFTARRNPALAGPDSEELLQKLLRIITINMSSSILACSWRMQSTSPSSGPHVPRGGWQPVMAADPWAAGYCLANWRLARRCWTADIIMAVSFVSEPEPTWQMIGALLGCKQCKPGISAAKSPDKPPKMKWSFETHFTLLARCNAGDWGVGGAHGRGREGGGRPARHHREHLESLLRVTDPARECLVLCKINFWSEFYLWRCLSVSAPNICLSWSASLCLCPRVLLMTSQKRCDKTNKNLESLRKRARPEELVTDCQWGSSGRKTRAT